MASVNLKQLKKLWAESCKTLWIEIAALRYLENDLRGRYAEIGSSVILTDLVYAPECKGRINDSTKDEVLARIDHYITHAVTLRVVLLSACFETYFSEFLIAYLAHRSKYFVGGVRTPLGNKVYGEVMKVRGLRHRVEAFCKSTNAKIASIEPRLLLLEEVCLLRNAIVHDGGICDDYSATKIVSIKVVAGQPISISSSELVRILAPPCIQIAEDLDAKIHPK